MGKPLPPSPAVLILAAFSRHDAALAWARQRSADTWGPVVCESPVFHFTETDYYRQTMGSDLRKVFFAFQRPWDPGELVEIKLETNRWEEEYALAAGHPETRPLNLDPGYVTLAKLVLASTKDFAHRVHLSRGIYAEITLQYRHHRWVHHEYTFPDYRRPDYQQFFTECREVLQRARSCQSRYNPQRRHFPDA
jgi:hypothetical protein